MRYGRLCSAGGFVGEGTVCTICMDSVACADESPQRFRRGALGRDVEGQSLA